MTLMIADPRKKLTMGVGLKVNRARPVNPEAWKQAMGTKRIPARLALLPEAKPQWDRIGVSAGVQFTIVLFMLILPLLFPDQMKTALNFGIHDVLTPITLVPVAPPPPPPPPVKVKVQPPPEVQPEIVEPVKLNPAQPHIFIQPKKVIQPKLQTVDAKPVDLNPVLEAAKLDMPSKEPKRPKDEVKVGMMSSGSAALATTAAPVEKVQTGGFGDPNGIPGKGDPNKAANVNRLGSPVLPGGPGFGNGTGGDKGTRGTVASAGFGNNTAVAPTKKGTLQNTGFANQTAGDPPKKRISTDAMTTAVTILDKPRPEYTAEGRSLRLEGDVVLDMVFLADGVVQVNKVLSGLGHGLDEAAVRAAQQIKFKPAKRDGQPVDFPARVRIEFRLAY